MLAELLLALATLPPHGPAADHPLPLLHSVATVNDPLSHGQVGDNLLSLNEAIQLYNRTLTTSQLSLAEQQQLGGFGSDIAWADIDYNAVPSITMERPFDVIQNLPHGLLVAGSKGVPTIDFSQTGGFVAKSDFVNFRNLDLVGGAFAIDIEQYDAPFGTLVEDVVFRNQTRAAVRVTMKGDNGQGRFLMDSGTVTGAPTALLLDGSGGTGRATRVFLSRLDLQPTTTGVDVTLGPGGTADYIIETSTIQTAGAGVVFRRPAGADRTLTLESTHMTIRAGDAYVIPGTGASTSTLMLRMLDLTSTATGGKALSIGPVGTGFGGHLYETRIQGDAEILGDLDVYNGRFRGGTVTFAPTSLPIGAMAFEQCGIRTAGNSAVRFDTCEIDGGTVAGTASAPVRLVGCHVAGGATLGSHATQSQPIGNAPVGSFSVQPVAPQPGGSLTFQADLPGGLFGIWVVGPTLVLPDYLSRDLHIYVDATRAVTVPGVYRLQQQTSLPVPNDPGLSGTEWQAHMAVFPDPGFAAPRVNLPPGTRFVIQ